MPIFSFLLFLLIMSVFPFWRKDYKVPFVPANAKDLECIKAQLKLGPQDVVYDLGCGTGGALARLIKDTGARGVGVELSPMLAFWGRIRRRSNPRLAIRTGNFFKADMSDATVVYCFLMSALMPRVADTLKEKLRPGTRVVSYIFPITGWPREQTIVNDSGRPIASVYRV